MNLAIIGCGIIGRRHLESIINSSIKDLNIFVIDTSNECLNECKKIAQYKNTLKIYYLSSVEETNKNFDFVIIATNSKDRFNAIVDLYNYKKPKFIILGVREKYLLFCIAYPNDSSESKNLLAADRVILTLFATSVSVISGLSWSKASITLNPFRKEVAISLFPKFSNTISFYKNGSTSN